MAGLVPSVVAGVVVFGWLPNVLPPGLVAVGLVIAAVGAFSSPLAVPVAIAALMSYRRQTPPSPRRTAWTALVIALVVPSSVVAAGVLWIGISSALA